MVNTLQLFPARVRFTAADGTLTNEAYRSLQALFLRVGGSSGVFSFTNLILSGSASIGTYLTLPPGTVAAPSLYWGANTGTGFYQIAANNVGYTVSGVNVLSMLSTGLTVTGVTTSTSFVGAGTGLTGTAPSLTAGNVTTNANLTGMVTSVGNATTVVTNANLTGPITSVGNATAVTAQTGTGTTFVMQASPTLTTPNIGVAAGTSLAATSGIAVGGATVATSGIAFPATAVAVANVNTLDDYEEGTWTPSDVSGAALSFSAVEGVYTKIGNVVHIAATLTYPVTASGIDASIGGLPFTAAAGNTGGGAVSYSTAAITPTLIIPGSAAIANPRRAAGGAAMTNAELSASVIRFSATYRTA
jgi:hypothetical protein